MSTRKRPSTTSLPPSPQDDESSRMRNYLLTMGIRIACIVLMVVVQPFGWYTWLFAVGAVFLPYIAVVIANVGKDAHETTAEHPDLALPSSTPPPSAEGTGPRVIRVDEAPALPSSSPSSSSPSADDPDAPAPGPGETDEDPR